MLEYAAAEWRLIRRGASPRDRLRLARISARMHARARGLHLRSRGIHHVRLDEGAIHLRLRPDDSVVFEVLGFGAYDFDLSFLGEVRHVLDAGANVGLTTLTLAERFPDARFGCVEASPDTHALLQHNLVANGVNGQALHAALCGEPRQVEISTDALPHYRHLVKSGTGGVSVEGITVSMALDRLGFESVDLLKLDIEGGEGEVFADATNWASRVRAIVAEVHAPLDVRGVARGLEPYGYTPRPLPPGELYANMLLMERGR